MITAHATAADFRRWEEMAKGMDTAALIYTVRDCRGAAAAMQGWNPNREGFYRDQGATYQQELDRRRRGGR